MLELPAALARDLEAGHAVVVPTAARATALRLAFTAWQLARGLRAFRTPVIHGLGGWLARQTLRGPQGDLERLGEAGEWLLWRAALASAIPDAPSPLVGVEADERLIEPLRRSAQLLCDWRIPESVLVTGDSAQHLLLGRVLQQVDQLAEQRNVLPAHRLLAGLARQPPRTAPVFAGFAELAPAQQALLDVWGGRASSAMTALDQPASSPAPATPVVLAAPDPETELWLAAQWCRQELQQDPRRRLLVIIPDLQQRAAQVARVFDEVLMPQSLLAAGEPGARAWVAEGGEPLALHPAVRQALRTLHLLCDGLEFEELSDWLRNGSPGLAALAGLDVALRSLLPPRCTVSRLLAALEQMPEALSATAAQVAGPLRVARELLEGRSRDSLGQWMARFQTVLSPFADMAAGARPLLAQQSRLDLQQAGQRWSQLLRECAQASAGLDADMGSRMRAGEALSVLGRLAQQARFEPLAVDAPVTVSAALADPVVRYDGIRVLGLRAGVLPAPLRLDPFIPVVAQRAAGLPQVSSAARLQQAQVLLQALRRGARELVLSWPQRNEDRECLPSSLLREFETQAQVTAVPVPVTLARTLRTGAARESFVDDAGTAWNPQVPLPMGTRAIELQSRCPFKAYAQLRLSATPLEAPAPGISASERGKLLHRALELLWRELAGREGLQRAWDAGQLDALVTGCARRAAVETLVQTTGPAAGDADSAANAVDEAGVDEAGAFRRAAAAREQARAQRLLHAHARLELCRDAFTVQGLERSSRITLGAAVLNARIDRIDQLPDGTQVIIDYKSGQPQTPDWLAERVTHPQLLVYLQAVDGQGSSRVSALAVQHITPRAVVYQGIADTAGRLPKVAGLEGGADGEGSTGAWQRQLTAWRHSVQQLAQDFVAGRARVDPAADACRNCHLQAFCRVGDTPEGVPELDLEGAA